MLEYSLLKAMNMQAFMPDRNTIYLFRERMPPAASVLMDMYTWFSHGSFVPEGNKAWEYITPCLLCKEWRFAGVICIIRVYGGKSCLTGITIAFHKKQGGTAEITSLPFIRQGLFSCAPCGTRF